MTRAYSACPRTVSGMNQHPETVHDWRTGDTWQLALDLADFRKRLILGDPENDWSHAEAEVANLDVYKRFDPVGGWQFAIYRLTEDGKHLRVGTINRVPDVTLLRELARNSVRNGFDWWADYQRVREKAVNDAASKAAEARESIEEKLGHLRRKGKI